MNLQRIARKCSFLLVLLICGLVSVVLVTEARYRTSLPQTETCAQPTGVSGEACPDCRAGKQRAELNQWADQRERDLRVGP